MFQSSPPSLGKLAILLVISPATFRDLVSGRRRGLFAALVRFLLRVIEFPYTWAVRLRNRHFDSADAVQHADATVVSVGNLTLGGTGKTPMVEWLARWFLEHGKQVTLVSRGYGAKQGAVNDEALELAQKLPEVAHLQNPDRVTAAREAVKKHAADVVLLDDGFQHRRLHRDLDIVLIDALEPFGFEHVFPRGTLREPLSGLARADVVALSRSDMLNKDQRAQLKSVVAQYAPSAAWCELAHSARRLLSTSGEDAPLDRLAGKRVAGFCGIGNPAGFRHTLQECGCQVIAWREFPDHFSCDPSTLAELALWVTAAQVDAVVCTHKDLVKIDFDELGGVPLWAMMVEMDVLVGQAELEDCLQAVLAAGGD